jgi:type II secretory ATPase GspE/PulE/Tfp pilus assembly ATPase PilB-like protein
VADDRSIGKDRHDDKEREVLEALGALFRLAFKHGADRILITPLKGRDNVTFIIPQDGKGNHRTATATEARWKEIVARIKFDASLNADKNSTSQEGEVVYPFGNLGRVFVSVKTEHCNGQEKVILLIA